MIVKQANIVLTITLMVKQVQLPLGFADIYQLTVV